MRKIKMTLDHLGGALDPHSCFLLERGLKTLALRVQYQNQSAGTIAASLAEHPAVKSVNYPGLETHPQHERASKLLDGYGGMMSFELHGGLEAAEAFLDAVQLPAVAASLGGAESLIREACGGDSLGFVAGRKSAKRRHRRIDPVFGGTRGN